MRRVQLEKWSLRAMPVASLRDALDACDAARDPDALSDLATRVASAVLVDPIPPIGDVSALIEPMLAATAPSARLAVLDLVNALIVAGVAIRPDVEARARRGLAELASLGPPLATRVRVGLVAIVYGDLELAASIAPDVPEEFTGSMAFPNDVLALLAYLVTATRRRAVIRTLQAAWRCVADELDGLCSSGQLDAPTVLWLARVIYQVLGRHPVAEVAALARQHLWTPLSASVASDEPPEFPLGDTLGGGAYRVDRHLRGLGAQTLWLGSEAATGANLLVACDQHNAAKQDVGALRRALDYKVPGIFELAYVGPFDECTARREVDAGPHWATVERVTRGTWLPRILGPADPWTAASKALALGRSAGAILLRASNAGVPLSWIRPELMWAESRGGSLVVTGVSPRAIELFAGKVGEMVTHPVFDRFYHAPEIRKQPDDRSVAYTLAVMMAEWATGRYPFASRYAPAGVETGLHEPISAPRPLAALLESTIRPDPGERPRLSELVAALDRLRL